MALFKASLGPWEDAEVARLVKAHGFDKASKLLEMSPLAMRCALKNHAERQKLAQMPPKFSGRQENQSILDDWNSGELAIQDLALQYGKTEFEINQALAEAREFNRRNRQNYCADKRHLWSSGINPDEVWDLDQLDVTGEATDE